MKLTSLCYMERDDSYLMLHRTKKANDENSGKYIGVGGRFEFGESPEECAMREIREETGLIPLALKSCGIVTFVSGSYCEYMFLYYCDSFSGELIDCDEGDLVWVKKKDIFSLNLWEGDRIFLELMQKKSEYFSLKLVYSGERLEQAYLNGHCYNF